MLLVILVHCTRRVADIIFPNAVLKSMAETVPRTLKEFKALPQVTEAKTKRYGKVPCG